MSKAAVKVKKFRSLIDKIEHSTKMRTFIPSGKATANPPLGPMLGQVNWSSCLFINLPKILQFSLLL